MHTIAFYDTKTYDRAAFEQAALKDQFRFKYFDFKLNEDTAIMAKDCDGVVAFVNDIINSKVIDILSKTGCKIIALRCAGFNNVDINYAKGKIAVARVPMYSPYAIAEHTMGLLLCVNRKIHRAYFRTRSNNFTLSGLTGVDLYGKTIGIIGTGKIGQVFINLCSGFNMKVLAYDPYPSNIAAEYVSLDDLCSRSDFISLHCPLNKETYHIINSDTLSKMRDGVIIINTSRGALIDTDALIDALRSGKVGGAGLDVYEEESDLFFEDFSEKIVQDEDLAFLLSMPNVLITSHQAFLTEEALTQIAKVTTDNLYAFFSGNTKPYQHNFLSSGLSGL